MAELTDVIMFGVIIFSLGIGLVLVHYTTGNVVDNMINQSIIAADNTTVQILEDTQTLTLRFDYMLFGVLIGLILATIIGGWLAGGSHPIFMFIYFIIIIIAIVISSIFSYIWNNLPTTIANHITTSNAFPITIHLLNKLPYYVLGIGFVGIAIMFSRRYVEG